MSAAVSKRQQARNERALQDLIHSVPGNEVCADCGTRNPTWASWSLGIFLCMRCAALHRKLGTHLSKVKSLSMDSWSADQLDVMKRVGNATSNKRYNPRNVKPDIPIDADEVDAAMEKYIRQKYQHQTLSTTSVNSAPATKQNTGSTGTGSWNDETPALPPKPGKRFGFTLRSASSPHPRDKQSHFTPPLSPTFTGNEKSPERAATQTSRKSSQIFGMKITSRSNSLDPKLLQLQEMGFPDNAKNNEILKSMNGNIERTVEVLARLGEGTRPISRSVTPLPRSQSPPSAEPSQTNGLVIEKTREPTKKSYSNPWEVRPDPSIQPPLPQAPPVAARSSSVPPPAASWNPFLNQSQASQPQQSLVNSFQNLQVEPTHSAIQPTPHTTQQMPIYAQSTGNPWQQQMTHNSSYGQQFQNSASPAAVNTANPFLATPNAQSLSSPANPWATQSYPPVQTSQPSHNPFGVPYQQPNIFQQPPSMSPAPIYEQQTDYLSVQPVQQQLSQQLPQQQMPTAQFPQQQPQLQHQPQQQFNERNPFQAQIQPQPQIQQPQMQFPQQQPQQQFPQQQLQQQFPQQQPQQQQQQNPFGQPFPPTAPTRHDKSSILALYGQPQLAPPRPLQTLPEDAPLPQQAAPQQPLSSQTFMNGNTANSMNPFAQQHTAAPRHISNQSLDFQGLAGNGRHSPDAFAHLSASYAR